MRAPPWAVPDARLGHEALTPWARGVQPARPGSMQHFDDAYKWMRDYITAIKAGSLHPFTAVERKTREATRREPW